MSLIENLQEMMCDIFDDDDLVISRTTTADDVDDWDSLTHISLVIAIEKKFSIKFSHGEIEETKNVGEFIDLLENKVQAN